MAKAFSDNEKEIILKRLKYLAKDCLQRFGVRKTTVDELVKMAGISKGAFYLFYSTKEILIFEVMTDFQLKLQNQLLETVNSTKEQLTSETISNLLFNMMKEVDGSFMITLVQNGDIEYLQRKLPEEIITKHQFDDDMILGKLCKSLTLSLPDDKLELFSASLRAIAMTMTAKKAIGEKYYDEVLMSLVKGVVEQLFK
jgi:AcrR family transcriptional regulator